jgi:hypothetical protein
MSGKSDTPVSPDKTYQAQLYAIASLHAMGLLDDQSYMSYMHEASLEYVNACIAEMYEKSVLAPLTEMLQKSV